jgi:TetR/AcrR family transcriptional regulator, regulator of autoinduction and epiphytic fitness
VAGPAGWHNGRVSVTDAGPRSARAEKTRIAIADALLSLIDEGDLQPTATRIADRAGISLRLIYHHFGDLEALFREAAERETVRLISRVHLVSIELPLSERLDAFVEQRCSLLEWMTPVCRAAALHAPFSATLQAARTNATAAGDHEVKRVFAAEIAELPAGRRRPIVDAMCMATSWNAWDELRMRERTEAESREAIRTTLRVLLGSPA